jgi:hypothetical protein
MSKRLRELLVSSGYLELARGSHSLRRGGAIASAAYGGNLAVVGAMGYWRSDSVLGSTWALRDAVEATTMALARRAGGELLQPQAGPVSCTARR